MTYLSNISSDGESEELNDLIFSLISDLSEVFKEYHVHIA